VTINRELWLLCFLDVNVCDFKDEVECLWNSACAWGILWVEFMEGEITYHRVYIRGGYCIIS
jgi:hypothetical protein